MKIHLYRLIFLLVVCFTLGCTQEDEKDRVEIEKTLGGRVVFSPNNDVPNQLKVLSTDGIKNLDSENYLDLPSSTNGLEFLLDGNNNLVFIRKSYPAYNNPTISSESTILFLTTFNTQFYKLSNATKALIIPQILDHPKFEIAQDQLDMATSVNVYNPEFRENIHLIVGEIFSEENLNELSGEEISTAPLVDVSYNSNNATFSNNTSNHVGYSIRKDGVQTNFGLLEGEQNFSINFDNDANYNFKMMSGADISGVFSNNQLEEIEAFNADFSDFMFEAITIILQLAIPTMDENCLEQIFSTLTTGINYAESYGNNNDAGDAFLTAFEDIAGGLPGLVYQGLECVEIDGGILGQILDVLNILNDFYEITVFLAETTQSITEYYAYDNLFETCLFYNGNFITECNNAVVDPVFNPSPENNASDQPLSGVLSFVAGSNTPSNATYKLYLGLTANPTTTQILTSTSATYANALPSTMYFWKIETLGPTGEVLATSPIWNFTTVSSNNTPVLTTNNISNITQTSAISGGNISNNGGSNIVARGVCWSISPNPTINDNSTFNGTGTGSFNSTLTNLAPNTTYYVRAYATNNDGTAYGNQRNFATTSNGSIPEISTTSIFNITQTSASSGGNITNNGGSAVIARGVCWSTNANPTTNNNLTNNGTGQGNYTSNLTNLNPNTTYYVRAYASNSEGTAYGGQEVFTTLNNGSLPTLTTNSVSNITQTTALSGGNITEDGGSNIAIRGVCWSVNPNPTTANDITNDGSGIGSYTSSITGLSENTTYYIRAYAVNDEGIAYGNQHNFTTGSNGQPMLVYTANEIDDDTSGGSNGNDNGIADAGEEIELKVQIQNVGDATANNVTATLSTSDPDITITDSDENYGDINPGNFEWNNDFDFDIDPNCPTKTVVFTLDIFSDEGSWTENFSITVQGQSGGGNLVTPTDSCSAAPLLQMDVEYDVAIDVGDYNLSAPIDGQSNNGNDVRGFWVKFNEPSGFVGDIDIKVYGVSNNFDPVIGHKLSCSGIYYTQWNLSTFVANTGSYGDSETFADHSEDNGYTHYVRIYHYFGSETPNIDFKIKIEPQ